MRGIAGVKDIPPLADVLEATEYAAHPLERGEAQTQRRSGSPLLGAAATVLRGIVGRDAQRRPRSSPASPELARFAAALDAMHEKETEQRARRPDRRAVLRRRGPTVVQRAANPPTSPAERFRLEVVSQGEHLRRLVVATRAARATISRATACAARCARRCARCARRPRASASATSPSSSRRTTTTSCGSTPRALDSLDEVADDARAARARAPALAAALRTAPCAHARTGAPAPRRRSRASAPPAVTASVAGARRRHAVRRCRRSATAPPPRPCRAGDERCRLAQAAARIDSSTPGIAKLGALPATPLAAPVAAPEQPPVPIDVLLYRGRAAIERAVEIRDQVRSAGGPVDAETLDELFDLLDLALTD